ncbi:MAG: LysR family transcriptional regulator [Rhodobacteraceae bacterium]|nr:LysR family transcriptional regulator [Paracoccaceae bacterium]
MDWDKLRIFHAVAAEGSLTRAGLTLHLSQSAVSRQISALEESLATILFHRHARGLILTEQGEVLHAATSAMSKRLEAATARIRDSKDAAFGELRVTTTVGFGTLWLSPRLHALYADYPDLRIDLILAERILDLPMREADVAIRMKTPSQADLIRRKIMSSSMQLFATRGYLDTQGTPADAGDLARHRLICQGAGETSGNAFVSSLLRGTTSPILTVNNYYGVLQGVLHDLGIGVLPSYLTEHFPDLVRVLDDCESEEIPVYLAYPVELRGSKRVQAFRNFVLEQVGS